MAHMTWLVLEAKLKELTQTNDEGIIMHYSQGVYIVLSPLKANRFNRPLTNFTYFF